MATNKTTPNMGLINPTPTQEPGPDYAQDISDALDTIDAHTHEGDGLTGSQLTQRSLNITGDLSFNQTANLTDVRTVRFTDQTSQPDGVGDVDCSYFKNGELWINDGTGTGVQITSGGAVNVTSANTVYGLQAVSTNWTIVSTDTYVFLAVDTTTARIVTLPTAASVSPGRYYIVADVTGGGATHNITINKAGSDTIGGASSHKVQAAYGGVVLVSDGVSRWKALDSFDLQNGAIALGSSPAQSGAIALSSAQAVKSRNAAGSADLNVISTDASDNLTLGDVANAKLSLPMANVAFTAGITPVIKQDVSVSGAGRNLSITAQGGASGTNNGADVVLTGGNRGNGSAVYGGVQLATGDGTTQIKVSTSAVKLSTVLQGQGTNVASVGDIQLRNASSIAFRNAANSADLVAVGADSSNQINLGNATGNTTITGTSNINLTVGAGTLNMTSSAVTSGGVNWLWNASSASPSIKQSDNTTNSATAQNLTIQSQSATGTGATGGDLALVSGTGTSQDGFITFKQGSATTCKLGIQNLQSQGLKTYFDFGATSGGMAAQTQLISNSYGVGSNVYFFTNAGTCHFGQNTNLDVLTIDSNVNFATSNVIFGSAIATPIIKQADLATNSGTGAAFTIQAQNETGTGSTGGSLTLTSGTGTTVAGNVLLKTGGTTQLTVSPTLITHAQPLAQGSTVATQGDIRMANLGSLYFRNAANSGNVAGLQIDGSNEIVLGDASNGNTIVNATSNIQLRTGANPVITATLTDVTIAAGLTLPTVTKTTSYTLDSTAGVHDYQIFSNQSAAISFTLPAPANGRQFIITDISGTANTNHITLVRNGSEKINGVAASYVYSVNFGTIRITSNGTDWVVS